MNIATEVAAKTLTDAIKQDAALYIAYQANIAMAFVDAVARFRSQTNKRFLNRRELHQVANEAADNFLQLWTQ